MEGKDSMNLLSDDIDVCRAALNLPGLLIIYRPGAAGVVLQTPSLLIRSLILFENIFKTHLLPNCKSLGHEILDEVHHPLCVTFHMSGVTCHMSHVKCHMSPVRCYMSGVRYWVWIFSEKKKEKNYKVGLPRIMLFHILSLI